MVTDPFQHLPGAAGRGGEWEFDMSNCFVAAALDDFILTLDETDLSDDAPALPRSAN